jgi:hypothetical protein
MKILTKYQVLSVHGGSTQMAANVAFFHIAGTVAGFLTGPYLMPPGSDSYSSQAIDHIIDMKAGPYGIHSKNDATGALFCSFLGGFAGSVLGALS